MGKDIVERLRDESRKLPWDWVALHTVLVDATAEIERLRALIGARTLAGAVSAGDGSFHEITKDLPRSDPSKHQVG